MTFNCACKSDYCLRKLDLSEEGDIIRITFGENEYGFNFSPETFLSFAAEVNRIAEKYQAKMDKLSKRCKKI
jgi:hypothetical protein